MAKFRYRAVASDGTKERGVIEAENITRATIRLRERNLYPEHLSPEIFHLNFRKVFLAKTETLSLREISEICREMALLLQGTIPLNTVIRLTRRQRSSMVASILLRVEAAVEQGVPFGQALQREEKLPVIFWQSVRAAELSGTLPRVCSELADHFDEEYRRQQKTAATLFYPKLILCCALLIVAGILTFLMPTYLNMFARSGIELPWATQVLIVIWDFIRAFWFLLIPGFILAWRSCIKFWQYCMRQPRFDRWMLNLPYLGKLNVLRMLAVLCRTMAMLLSSGIALDHVLFNVERLPPSCTWQNALHHARARLRAGQTLSEAFEEEGCFPDQLLHLLSIGESSGNLDQLLRQVASYYQQQATLKAERLNYLLQPIVMLFAALFIGGLALALMMPLYAQLDLIQDISHLQ